MPRINAPAARSRATTPHHRAGTSPLCSRLPISHLISRVAIDDFTVTGKPNNGLRDRVPRHASCFRARSRTRSASKSANAFNCGFSRSIWRICASANSVTEICAGAQKLQLPRRRRQHYIVHGCAAAGDAVGLSSSGVRRQQLVVEPIGPHRLARVEAVIPIQLIVERIRHRRGNSSEAGYG